MAQRVPGEEARVMLSHIGARFRRIGVCTFLAAMPLAVELPEAPEDGVTFGAHAGGGRVVSVVRDCEGNALSSRSHPFGEVCGSIDYTSPATDTGRLVIGVRGGRIAVENQRLTLNAQGTPTYETFDATYDYLDPHASFEGRTFGLGIGYLAGNPPPVSDGNDTVRTSGHLRVGRLTDRYFEFSMNEGLPLLTSGGPYSLGIGYPVGSRVHSFTGLSFGFYDGAGWGQSIAVTLAEGVVLDLGFRFAMPDGKYDGGASAGLRVRIPSP